MAQTAPSSDKSADRAANSPLVPPDERFWQRYSPHAEFPLSSAGSIALHLLVFGVLALMAWLGAILFSHSSRSLPVEAVRLDLGGGGGNPHGQGEGANNGPQPQEVGQANEGTTENVPSEDIQTPKKINVKPDPKVKPQFEVDPQRVLQQSDSSQVFRRLRERAKQIQMPSGQPSGRGQGGTGEGGGSGDGQGSGTGNGRGAGQVAPTQREKRGLRWNMLLNTQSSSDYVAQLHGLGAILAIPVREEGEHVDYKIVRDLSARPAKLVDADLDQIQRMVNWLDNKPESVQGVMNVLRLPLRPSHFYAFMPEKLEQKLLQLEIAYLNKRHRGRTEDDILETKFRIKVRGGKYEPEVIEQKVK